MKLVIGYSGDKNAVKRSIPIRTYQERWPGTSPSLLYCRPGETTPYIVSGATVSGGTLTWTISATDAEKSGPGYAQVIFSNPAGTVVGHGDMIDIEVLKSIGEASTAPTPLQVWQTEAARIQALYQQIFDDYNAGRLTGPKGDKGDPGTPGTPGAAGANGRDGRDGRDGSDANVTSENIKAALGVDVVQAISNAEEQIDELDEGKADSNHVHTWEEIQERPTIPAAYDDTALSGRVSELQSDIADKQDTISDLDTIRSGAAAGAAALPANPSNWPTMTSAQQDTACAVVGAERAKGEWVLKGQFADANGCNVDLTGCTELLIKGFIEATASTDILGGGMTLVAGMYAASKRRHFISKSIYECGFVVSQWIRYRDTDTSTDTVTNYNGVSATSSTNPYEISSITSFYFRTPSNVTACNVTIYAR